MSRPKFLQCWSEDKTHIIIQVRSPQLQTTIKANYGSWEPVRRSSVLGLCHFGDQQSSIVASEDGWIVWDELALEASPQYQRVACIYTTQEAALAREVSLSRQAKSIMVDEEAIQSQQVDKIHRLKFMDLCNMMAHTFIIKKWRVQVGELINKKDMIGSYTSPLEENKFISPHSGRVMYLAELGVELNTNDIVLELEPIELICHHLKVEHGRCIYCSQQVDIRQDDDNNCFPSWQLDQPTIKKLALEMIKQQSHISNSLLYYQVSSDIVLRQKKLIMVLDLDQTILHAIRIRRDFQTKEFVRQRNADTLASIQKRDPKDSEHCFNDFGNTRFPIEGIFNNQYVLQEEFLEMSCDRNSKYLIKLRPYYQQFFKELLPQFDIYIYTKASRNYADFILEHIQRIIGPHFNNRTLFPHNHILSRDETSVHTSKNLNRLFPPGLANNFMIILDDNAQMWRNHKQNYLPTKPFVYFQEGTAKDAQGINCEMESDAKIVNDNDHWLLCISQEIRLMAEQFWKKVDEVPQIENKRDKKNSKVAYKSSQVVQEGGREENQKREVPLSLTELIEQQKINIQSQYLERRKQILQGVTLYFAISKQHSPEVQSQLELAKRIAQQMGAKIYLEFREQNFIDTASSTIITHEMKKIKSTLVAQERQLSITHMKWVFDCEVFMKRLSFQAYNLQVYSVEQIENDTEREEIAKIDYFNSNINKQ